MATVLLVGKRTPALDELAEIVEGNGHFVVRTDDFSNLDVLDIAHTDIVAFGQVLHDEQVLAMQDRYRQKNPRIQFVRGLVPMPELLAIQITAALTAARPQSANLPAFDRQAHAVQVPVSSRQSVRITVWWLNILYRPKMKIILEDLLEPGNHTVVMPAWASRRGYYCTAEMGKQDAYTI